MAERVCPVWVGYLLASPLRKLFQNPKKILSPYVSDGMKVLDVGCAMGFFSLSLARLVGSDGKVICVDLQQKMIDSLEKRARKIGLLNRIETRVCSQESLGLDNLQGKIDFALASAVVHEVPDVEGFFAEIYGTLKPAAKFLVAEPKGHVSEDDFEVTISIAEKSGFKVIGRPKVGKSRSVILECERKISNDRKTDTSLRSA